MTATALLADAAGNVTDDASIIAIAVAGGLAVIGIGIAVVRRSNGPGPIHALIVFGAFLATLITFCFVRSDSRDALGAIAGSLALALAQTVRDGRHRASDPLPPITASSTPMDAATPPDYED